MSITETKKPNEPTDGLTADQYTAEGADAPDITRGVSSGEDSSVKAPIYVRIKGISTKKKLIIFAVLIIAILGIYFIFFHSTPELTLERYCSAVKKGDIWGMISYTYETSFDTQKSPNDYYNEFADPTNESSIFLAGFIEEAGKLDVDITDVQNASKEEVEALKDQLSPRYKTNDINEVKSASLTIKNTETGRSVTTDVKVIKVGWKWYVYAGG